MCGFGHIRLTVFVLFRETASLPSVLLILIIIYEVGKICNTECKICLYDVFGLSTTYQMGTYTLRFLSH